MLYSFHRYALPGWRPQILIRVNFLTYNRAGHKLIIIHSLKNRIDNWYQHVLYNDFVFLQFLSPLYDDKSKTLLWCQLSVLEPGFPSIVDSLHLQKVQKHTIASVFLLPKYIFVVFFHFQWVLVSVVVMYKDYHLTYLYFCRAWSVLDQHGLGPPAEERVIANLDRVWKRHASTPRRFL